MPCDERAVHEGAGGEGARGGYVLRPDEDGEWGWRARCRPLQQEPEWQLSDRDVAMAWRQVDETALDKCSPAAMLDLATDVVSTLGRWPTHLFPRECPQERRLEVRVARVLNAYLAKP